MDKNKIEKNASLWGYRGMVYTPEDLDEHIRRFRPFREKSSLDALIYYQAIINFFALKASEMDLKIKEARDNF